MVFNIHSTRGSWRFVSLSSIDSLAIESNLCILLWSGQEQGILVLNNAITSCTESIEQHKGKLVVKEAPRAVSVTSSIFLLSIFY